MDREPRGSAYEYIGLSMLMGMLGSGILAVALPQDVLTALVRVALTACGAM